MKKQKKIRKVVSILCVTCLVLGPAIVQAAPAPSKPGKVQSIRKGAPAPFDGVIYDTQSHALLVSKTKAFQSKLKLELDFLREKMTLQCKDQTRSIKADLQMVQRQLKLESDTREEQKRFLLGQITSAQKIQWYREPLFSFGIGFLVCALITGLSIWGLKEIQK